MKPAKLPKAADATLPVEKTMRPAQGWLRTMREGLGLTLSEMAGRLKVTPPAVRSFEQAEAEDRITLASLRRAAAAMECDLFYVLVSRTAAVVDRPSRGKPPVKAPKPTKPPETGRQDDASFVTDLTRHTEYGES